MKKICIVGGGTAGLVTALILKTRFSSLQIDIIKSDKIGIIGVGEGSTEHWKEFANFVGCTYACAVNNGTSALSLAPSAIRSPSMRTIPTR